MKYLKSASRILAAIICSPLLLFMFLVFILPIWVLEGKWELPWK